MSTIFLKEEALRIDLAVIGTVFACPAGIAYGFRAKIQAVAHRLDAHVRFNGCIQVAGGIRFGIQRAVGGRKLVGRENNLPNRGTGTLYAVHDDTADGQLAFIRTPANLALDDFCHQLYFIHLRFRKRFHRLVDKTHIRGIIAAADRGRSGIFCRERRRDLGLCFTAYNTVSRKGIGLLESNDRIFCSGIIAAGCTAGIVAQLF